MIADEIPAFRLLTLGLTALEQRGTDGTWISVMRASKPLALLVYLAAAPRRTLSREQLADTLWGDESPERARASLRQAVYALRQVLGEDILHTERDVLSLSDRGLWCDRDAFIAAVRRNDFDSMLGVYGGEFCASLSVGAAAAYERWMTTERAHLEQMLLDRAQSVIPARLAAGDTDTALANARDLEAYAAQRSEVQVLLFDSLVAAGDRLEAAERLAAHATRLSATDAAVPPAIAERLARVRRVSLASPPQGTSSLVAVGEQLIGRDGLLSSLSREAEVARAGGSRRVVLSGPAGVGKTRVLDELEARLRLRGARVVRVSLRAEMHDVPFAALVELVRALVELPGALGVGEATARHLIDVVPDLRSKFPGVPRDAATHADGLRGLQHAVSDLLSSVAEERLVVVMMDNLHYADDATVQVLTGTQAQSASRLLEVWTSRRGAELPAASSTAVIDVLPLTSTDVVALLESVAHLPAEPWTRALADALFRRSRGVPLLVLAAVRSLGAAGLLRVSHGTWVSERPEALVEMANATAGTAALVAAVDSRARLALEVLAEWGRPMEERDVIGTLHLGASGASTTEWRACLRRLESLGLVQSRDATWGVAHDTVADELRATSSSVLEDSPRELLFEYWSARSRLSVPVLEQLALLSGHSETPAFAVRLARAASGVERLHRAGLRGRELTGRIARMSGRAEWAPEIHRSIGFIARQSDAARFSIAMAAVLVMTGLIVLVDRFQPRIVVETVPMAEYGRPGTPAEFVVQPRVRIENGFGTPLSLRVPVRLSVSHGQLVGESQRVTENGRLQFEGISMIQGPATGQSGQLSMTYDGPWYVRSGHSELLGMRFNYEVDQFRVIKLSANGVPVGDEMIVTAALGDSILFDLTFEYTTLSATANYIVGAMPTWGRRETAAIRLAGLPRPVHEAWRQVTFAVPSAPAAGDYYVVILMDLEDTVDHLFSGTSWQYGAPRWYDGNDVVDQPREVFEALRQSGNSQYDGKSRADYARQGTYRVGGAIVSRSAGSFEADTMPEPLMGRAVLVRFR